MLAAEQWESRLVAHYLRSDGPFGGAPLEWLDATPAELAIAGGIQDFDDTEVQEAFLAQFDSSSVSDCLARRELPVGYGARGPGYFRYLVLTCFVLATDEGAGDTRNFRTRLGTLLKGQMPLKDVSSVNWLWRRLVAWVNRRREAGEPYRSIELPDPGSMTLIGHAVRLAFPSWRDRSALTTTLVGLPDVVRRSPRHLVEELRRPHLHSKLPAPLASALDDFSKCLRSAPGLVGGHRFWRLVESIDERIQAGRKGAASERWQLEVSFGGWEGDLVDARLMKGSKRATLVPEWQGTFAELIRLPFDQLPIVLVRRLQQSALILSEAPGALWITEDVAPASDQTVVVLAKLGSVAQTWRLHTQWHEVGGGWTRSDRLAADAIVGLMRHLDLPAPDRERVTELGFEGGVPTRRGSWLGRSGFLPEVRTSERSLLTVRPLPPNSQSLEVSGGTILRPLETHRPVTGRWSVSAADGGVNAERVLILEADFPERLEWAPEQPAWTDEVEMVATGDRNICLPWLPTDNASPHPFDDLLEALYAHVGGGRGEAEVVELVQGSLPKAWLVWDVLRALAEAGWMVPRVYESWRARRWRLCPPSLVVCGDRTVLVEGALGAAARNRLREEAARLGGRVFVHRTCDWAPPVIGMSDVQPAALAQRMEWPMTTATRPLVMSAPECWPKEIRSVDARQLIGMWDFELGMFRPPTAPLPEQRLERLFQDTDRDLYRITGTPSSFVTTSRTVAILEAHRRTRRPLFRWCDGELQRIGRSGHLPLAIARTLRRLSLFSSGPREVKVGAWTYGYTADAACAAWVARVLGPAVEIPSRSGKLSRLSDIVACRRAGLAPAWWTAPLGRSTGFRP